MNVNEFLSPVLVQSCWVRS